MTGRKPKPAALRIAEGNRSRTPTAATAGPHYPAMNADPPAWLPERAAAVWRQLVPELLAAGVVTVADGPAAALLCQAIGEAEEAQAIIDREGLTVREAGGTTKKHPMLTVLNQASQRAARYMAEFGLTPCSRSRLPGREPAGDALDEFLRRKPQTR